MSLPLHSELKALSNGMPAGYLDIDVIGDLTVNRLVVAAELLKGMPIPTGQRVLSAKLMRVGFTAGVHARFVKTPGSPPDSIDIAPGSDLVVDVEIFVTGDPPAVISVVHFTISDIRIHLSGSANAIIVEGTDFTSTSQISRSVDADARLAAAGIDPLEAARVEGHISYGVVTSALGATLGQRREIALDRLFPAINFGDSIALSPLQNGEFLAFVPVAKHGLRRDAHCECNEATGIAISTTAVTDKTIPANPVPNDQIGKVTIGGPIAENLNPMADLGHRAPGKGRAGLLLPKETYHGMTVTAMPAVVVRASDNGFIGFDARGTVGFQEANVSLDAASGGIIVSVKMDISVTATSTLDMGKGRRLPIGYAIITPVAGSSAELEMGFYPYVDDGGTVRLRGTLQKCDMGTYIAVVLGIGTALKIIGVAAWIGFLIDVVLSAIISNNLPIVLRRSVVKAIGAGEWKLIGGDSIAQLDGFPKGQHFVARYDVDGDSLLVSFGTDKG